MRCVTMAELRLSTLPKTWVIDVDGVVFRHNEYKALGEKEVEKPLPGVKEFFARIPAGDSIILLSARKGGFREKTTEALKAAGIRFDALLLGLPTGERILINDEKPDGLKTAYAVNLKRDGGLGSLKFKNAEKR